MPTYEYKCKKCGNVEERIRPIDKRDFPATCSECESDMQREAGAPALGAGLPTPKFYPKY